MSNNTLYLECLSGISGDMTVAALLDLGADRTVLEKALDSLSISGFQIQISRVKKAGLDACDFQVILDEHHENHDHDMEYLHGQAHNHEAEREHPHIHHHSHDYSHDHRGLPEIMEIIQNAVITDRAKQLAAEIFDIIGQAEAKAHGVPLNEVHFHEVGAVDSIVDIVAVAVCIDNLDITKVIVPELSEGKGTIRCQHGIIPVPVPAVMHIAEAHGLILHITEVHGELVTPTGAAIVAAIKTSDRLPERFVIRKSGTGAGKRTYERPSILRAMLIEEETSVMDCIYKLESNIDDCTGEALGFVMERLLHAGARDVHYIPVFMKKNRPAYQLNVICAEKDIKQMEQIIFEETTTIGIRRMKLERTVLTRDIRTIDTSLGQVKVKVCELNHSLRIYPEYESVAALCRQHQLPYQQVWNLTAQEARQEICP